MSEQDMKKTIRETNAIASSQRVENAKSIIDGMIASIREKIDLKEASILDSILRTGGLELEDGTTIAYHDMVMNGVVQDTSLSIFSKDHKSQWEINGAKEQYQIFNMTYGDKKIKTSFGAEIKEMVSSRSQQYNGATVISIDNKRQMQVIHNELSGFETIGTTVFSLGPDYSLFLKKGDSVEYKGEYDFATIKMATYDIKGISQMQEENLIYDEQQLNEWNKTRESLGFRPPKMKSEEKVQEMLDAREDVLRVCDPLLGEAQQVVGETLEKIKKEKSIGTRLRRLFGQLLGSKSLSQLAQEKEGLEAEEADLYSDYLKSQENRSKKDGKDELQ